MRGICYSRILSPSLPIRTVTNLDEKVNDTGAHTLDTLISQVLRFISHTRLNLSMPKACYDKLVSRCSAMLRYAAKTTQNPDSQPSPDSPAIY